MRGHLDEVRLWLITKLEDTKAASPVSTDENAEPITAIEMWQHLQDPLTDAGYIYIAQMYCYYQLANLREAIPSA